MPDRSNLLAFRLIVLAAFADGKMSGEEQVLVYEYAERLNISPDEMQAAIAAAEAGQRSIELDATVRGNPEYLRAALKIIKADSKITAEEWRLARRLGRVYGFSEDRVRDMLDEVQSMREQPQRIFTPPVNTVLGVACLLVAVLFAPSFRSPEVFEGPTHISADYVNSDNDGKVVHVVGLVRSGSRLQDTDTGLQVEALRMWRQVEMCQWVRRRNYRYHKPNTRYRGLNSLSYSSAFYSKPIDSSGFDSPYKNPEMLLLADDWSADTVTLGEFQLSPSFVKAIVKSRPLSFTDKLCKEAGWHDGRAIVRGRAFKVEGARLRYSPKGAMGSPGVPAVGTTLVTYKVIPYTKVSIIARQVGRRLVPLTHKNGDDKVLLREGKEVPAHAMGGRQRRAKLSMSRFNLRFLAVCAGVLGLLFLSQSNLTQVISNQLND